MNYGNDTYNPGYCGIFGIIAMVFRGGKRPPTTPATLYEPVGGSETPNSGIGCGGPVGKETKETKAATTESETTKETTETTKETTTTEESENWIRKWKKLLEYMRQDIPDEPASHGCMGTNLAARVQEIIAAHPSTTTGHQQAEKEILREIKQALKTFTCK